MITSSCSLTHGRRRDGHGRHERPQAGARDHDRSRDHSPRTTSSLCRTSSSPPSTTGNARLTSRQRQDGRADKQSACHPMSCNGAGRTARRAEYRYLLTRDLGSLLTLETPPRVLFCMLDRDRDLRRPDDTLRIRFAVRGVATDIAVINLDRPRTNSPRSTTRLEPDDDDGTTGHRCESDHRSVGSTTREGIRRTGPYGHRHTHPTRRCPPLGANPRPLATRATRSTYRPTRRWS